MIGFSKLLCGRGTVSDVMRQDADKNVRADLLQFSQVSRPIVVWNTTNRCNLKCKHCYLGAEDRDYSGELTTEQAIALITDLGQMKVPVLLFSGGEPLVRKDLFELARHARQQGLRIVLSSNGALITAEMARKLKEAEFAYVGISIDGLKDVHDDFRGVPGAFDAAIQGIRNAMNAGLKAGARFTVNKLNYRDLPEVLEMMAGEGIPRFCMYHLVYAGRGTDLVKQDLTNEERRELVEMLVEKTMELDRRGVEMEVLTTDNHADGIFIYREIEKKQPERAEEVRQLLAMHGGCSACEKIANIDPRGDVHPCQFWMDKSLGNVKDRPFSEIWADSSDAMVGKLREKAKHLKGRCGSCRYRELCAGCRIRAEVVHGDMWQEDPCCYLTGEEIGG